MTIAVIDVRAGEPIISALSREGFLVVTLPACERLPVATASHPDMLLMRLGDISFTEALYRRENAAVFDKLKALLPEMKICSVEHPLGDRYPTDCRLNALLMGDKLFIKSDTASPEISEKAAELGIKIISVKQGYPACTVLALGESHAITSDRGMAAALRAEGIEVLLIDNGGILLPPYEYGFIGGAAGVYGKKVYFLGDISTHKCSSEICSFCRAAGYEPISLADGPLRDLGRIIFIDP